MKVLTRATLSSEGLAGGGPASELIQMLADSSSGAVGVEASVPCWLGTALSLLPCGSLLEAALNMALGFY